MRLDKEGEREETGTDQLVLSINRSDYMLHSPDNTFLQVPPAGHAH